MCVLATLLLRTSQLQNQVRVKEQELQRQKDKYGSLQQYTASLDKDYSALMAKKGT